MRGSRGARLRPANEAEVGRRLRLDRERLQESLEPGAIRVAERLLDAVEEEGAAGARVPDFSGLAEEVRLDDSWAVVEAIHEALDRAAADGDASPPEIWAYRNRVTEVAGELARAYVSVELRAYREMLGDISHDIRSPLNSILFLTDGLFKEQSGPLSDTQKRQLGIIYSAAASLLNLVNDVLDFARTEEEGAAGVAEVPFSLEGVCSDVERLVGPLVINRDTDFALEIDAEEARRGDPQILCRILVNLASNAVEAADEGGWVRIRVSEESDDADELVVEVEDDAYGTDVDRLREFIEPHTEREMTRMLRGRTHGLGLHICSRLVRKAGGAMRVVESDEGGSCFVVEFPFPRQGE